MMMKNKTVLLILTAIILLLPNLADARRVREEYSPTEIANIIVRSSPFYRHEPIFLSGILDNISGDVAHAIEEICQVEDVISFSDLIEKIKKDSARWIDYFGRNHLIIYGFYSHSEENGHTADDVIRTIAKLQEGRTQNIGRYPLHIIISENNVDFSVFTKGQLTDTPFDSLEYYEFINGKLEKKGGTTTSSISETFITNTASDIESKLGLSNSDSLDIVRRVAAISRDEVQLASYIGNINGILGVRLVCNIQRDARVNNKAFLAIKEFVGLMEIVRDEARIDKLFGLVKEMNEKLNQYAEDGYPVIYNNTFIALGIILNRNIYYLDRAIREAKIGIERAQDPISCIIAFGAYPQ